MEEETVCPICLDDILDGGGAPPALSLPYCGHKMHIRCALMAIRHDNRCPVCRSHVVPATESVEPDPPLPAQVQEELLLQIESELNRMIRRYRDRRARLVRNNEQLRELKRKLDEEQRQYRSTEDELIRTWKQAQRRLWSEDEALQVLKTKTTKHRRQVTRMTKRLRQKVEDAIGRPPLPYPEPNTRNIRF